MSRGDFDGSKLDVGTVVFGWPDRLTDISSWHGHIPFGYWCIDALRPHAVVELGTHKGDSYCSLCEAVVRLSLSTLCYAVDTWEGDHEAGWYSGEVLEDLRAYHDPRYARFSRLVQATFDEALAHFPDGAIDLLHVDGLHTYEAVRHDFETWLPKLSSSAVVLFHDINVREKDFAAWRYWLEISARYPHFTFHHSHGLGVLIVGAEAPEPVRRLAGATPDEAEYIRAFFARLGDGILTASRLHAAESRIGGLSSELAQGEILAGELRRRMSEYERDAQRLHGELAGRSDEIERLHSELAGRSEEIERLHSELAGRSDEIERLRAEVTNLEFRAAMQPRESALASALDRLRGLAVMHLPRPLAIAYQRRLLAGSRLFDAAWYLERYPDVAASGMDPMQHYLAFGAREGRDPHPSFGTGWYLLSNPDVAAMGINPLVHYKLYGAREGRWIRTRAEQ
jgi:hypothetical protein